MTTIESNLVEIQTKALDRAIAMAIEFSSIDSPLVVYRAPDSSRYRLAFKDCVDDYRPEWVVWPVDM